MPVQNIIERKRERILNPLPGFGRDLILQPWKWFCKPPSPWPSWWGLFIKSMRLAIIAPLYDYHHHHHHRHKSPQSWSWLLVIIIIIISIMIVIHSRERVPPPLRELTLAQRHKGTQCDILIWTLWAANTSNSLSHGNIHASMCAWRKSITWWWFDGILIDFISLLGEEGRWSQVSYHLIISLKCLCLCVCMWLWRANIWRVNQNWLGPLPPRPPIFPSEAKFQGLNWPHHHRHRHHDPSHIS